GFSFSGTGSLAYIRQADGIWNRTLVWLDRRGRSRPLAVTPHPYTEPRLSPDGRRLAVCADYDIWLYYIPRETFTRLTFGGNNCFPSWSPDGKRVVFASNRAGPWAIFWKAADGNGPDELLMRSEHTAVPQTWSPDGQLVLFLQEA